GEVCQSRRLTKQSEPVEAQERLQKGTRKRVFVLFGIRFVPFVYFPRLHSSRTNNFQQKTQRQNRNESPCDFRKQALFDFGSGSQVERLRKTGIDQIALI